MIASTQRPSRSRLDRRLQGLLGAAGVAIAVALALSIYALTFGDSNRTVEVSPGGGGAAPICRDSQLTASAELNGATGSLLGAVMIADTSRSPCSLPSRRPHVRITTLAGALPVREAPLRLPQRLAPRLAHGAMAEILVQWRNWCGRAPTGLTLEFGGGLAVTARLARDRPPCSDPSAGSAIGVSRPLRMR
jgi:hypothetical protein